MSQASVFGPSWQGSLADLANIVHYIQRVHAFGRLSLRNLEHMSIAHLYFRSGKLVHIISPSGDARAVLRDLYQWRRAALRFDRSVNSPVVTLTEEHDQLLMDALGHLYRRGLLMAPPVPQIALTPGPITPIPPVVTVTQLPTTPLPMSAPVATSRIVESDFVGTSEARQLITPLEWRVLLEGTRRVSLAVAHLVGAREALNVLQDILEDCSATFPAFACLKIAPSGYLQVTDLSHLDHLSRMDLLEGFTALIAICQHFCAPIIGEADAHKLMIQALQDLAPALTSLGVFRIDNQLLARNDS